MQQPCLNIKPSQLCTRPSDHSLTICDTDAFSAEVIWPSNWESELWDCVRDMATLPSTTTYMGWLAKWTGNCNESKLRAEQLAPLFNLSISRRAMWLQVDVVCSVVNELFIPLLHDLPELLPIMADVQRRHDSMRRSYKSGLRTSPSAPLALLEVKQLSFACLRAQLRELLPAAVIADRTRLSFEHRPPSLMEMAEPQKDLAYTASLPSKSNMDADSPPGTEGRAVAEALRHCQVTHVLNWSLHPLEAVISYRYRFVFADNVKAGSVSTRHTLYAALNVSWQHKSKGLTEVCQRHVCGNDGRCLWRTSTLCLTWANASRLFKFGMARDPVRKFESGVRQIWAKSLQNHSADEILAMQLALPRGEWLNTHLQPNTWRLSAALFEGGSSEMAPLDFIGKVEEMDRDWNFTVKHGMSGLNASQQGLMLPMPHIHSSNLALSKFGKNSTLSPAGIRLMCNSDAYKWEWKCLKYQLPPECAE